MLTGIIPVLKFPMTVALFPYFRGLVKVFGKRSLLINADRQNPIMAATEGALRRVRPRGGHVGVPEQLLNRADVIAICQKMRGKGRAQGVRAGWLRDVGLEPCIFDGPLEN